MLEFYFLCVWCIISKPAHLSVPNTQLDMPAWYLHQVDPWQLSLKYSNSATELPNDSVAQMARVWQAICQVVGLSPFLSHCHFSPSFCHIFISHLSFSMTLTRLRSDCQIWSMFITGPAPRTLRSLHPTPLGFYPNADADLIGL